MKIIRVFPTKTSFSPDDEYCFFDVPPMIIPDHDEVHVSCIFTWDIPKAKELQRQWECRTDKPVKIGGPAFDDPGADYIPGRYVRHGITFTSRGCNNNCPFCFVPKREGKIRELPIMTGNIIQDNNFTQCSKYHQDMVFNMLKSQSGVKFKGGLEASRITTEFVNKLRGIKISEIWLAYDGDYAHRAVERAAGLLRPYFNRNKLRCFVLVGFRNDTIEKATDRLKTVFNLGFLPFAQLYKSGNLEEDNLLKAGWGSFVRTWSLPAAYKSVMKQVNQ